MKGISKNMNKDISEKALKALERQEKQYKRQNEFSKQNYDRISVVIPKGKKDTIKEYANRKGMSLNEYIQKAIEKQMLDDDKINGLELPFS